MIWKQAKDDVSAGQSLLQHFPEAGTYYVPASTHDPETLERLFQKGPIALVHMISSSGRPVMDPSIMIQGFLLNLVVIVLIGLLLRRVSASLPSLGRFVESARERGGAHDCITTRQVFSE